MLFTDEVVDAFRFIFSDYRVYLQIGTVLFLISIIRKLAYAVIDNPYIFWSLVIFSELLLYLQVGYGSYISLYTLKGRDYLPKIRNIKKIFFEGIKKSYVIYIYVLIIISFSMISGSYFNGASDILVFVVHVLIYCVMILGLINRYLHHGNFIRAFNAGDMRTIFENIKLKNFALVVVCVFFSQFAVANSAITYSGGLSLFNVVSLVASFFIAPAVVIFSKRLTALHIRKLFADSIYHYKLE